MPNNVKNIIVELTLEREHDPELLMGLKRYMARHQLNWRLLFVYYYDLVTEPGFIDYFKEPDGMVLRTDRLLEMGVSKEIPRVYVESTKSSNPNAIGFTAEEIGKRAARYLMKNAEGRMCFWVHGNPNLAEASSMEEGFRQTVVQAGRICEVFRNGRNLKAAPRWNVLDEMKDLTEFIQAGQPEINILVHYPYQVLRLLQVLERLGRIVPDQVKILCAHDDPMLFETIEPSISAMHYANEEVGFMLAKSLHHQFQGKPEPETDLSNRIQVLERYSTSYMYVNDEVIEAVVQYLWTHVHEQLKVQDLLNKFPIAQRTLTRHFKRVYGHGPQEEIRRSRLVTAKRLLSGTDLPLLEVAIESGYGSQSQLGQYIKKETGKSPGAYRAQYRMGNA